MTGNHRQTLSSIRMRLLQHLSNQGSQQSRLDLLPSLTVVSRSVPCLTCHLLYRITCELEPTLVSYFTPADMLARPAE